ncbi:MAG: YjbQ family protein [Euryarchaeota archaeon]|nr:YjbQ family protein [Euryarchaeota archaeon]
MRIASYEIEVELEAEEGFADITARVQEIVEKSGIRQGVAVVFNVGSTGAITTMEFEPGLRKDIPRALERVAPRGESYEHHLTWGDDNGAAHVRAALLGPGLTVPIVDGRLTLGTWQQIVVINFDTRRRRRRVVVQLLGE